MAASKIAISLDENILRELDILVRDRVFSSRSRAIQEAVKEKIEKITKNRLAIECAKLDPKEEIEFAEEGINGELDEWPEY